MSGLGEERCGGQSRRPCAVAMATVVQDEARWLPEWLEYHLALGFGHFYLYDDGSADELDATLAPYLEEGVATLHRVAELGPLPTTRRVYSAPRNCTPLAGEMPMWRDERGWCITRLHFPQQVAVVRHALEAYGGCSSWMAFFDVDEFLVVGARSAPSYLGQLRSSVGGVRVEHAIMLPKDLHDYSPPSDELLLTRTMVRQAAPAVAPRQFDSWKCIIRPSQARKGEAVFGSIHRLQLEHGARYHVPRRDSGEAQLVHFRYRTMSSYAGRSNKTYLSVQLSPGALIKRRSMARWSATLEAAQQPGGTRMQDAPLLGFVADIYRGLVGRWDSPRWAGSAPASVRALLAVARPVAARRAILLVAEARSGSSLVGELAFNSRPDVLYLYEPCRQLPPPAPPGQGRLHNATCLEFAVDALGCRLALRPFERMARDRSFQRFSGAGRTISRRAGRGRPLLQYSLWLHTCWTSHAAVKVIRAHDLRMPDPKVAASVGVRILHLVRNPAEVARSRASLKPFLLRGPFNPTGDAEGLVANLCAGLRAKQRESDGGGAPTAAARPLLRVRFEDFLAQPAASLERVHAWAGLAPASSDDALTRCGLSEQPPLPAAAAETAASEADLPPPAFRVCTGRYERAGEAGGPRREDEAGAYGEWRRRVEGACGDVLRLLRY